jgi:hypothetical protein
LLTGLASAQRGVSPPFPPSNAAAVVSRLPVARVNKIIAAAAKLHKGLCPLTTPKKGETPFLNPQMHKDSKTRDCFIPHNKTPALRELRRHLRSVRKSLGVRCFAFAFQDLRNFMPILYRLRRFLKTCPSGSPVKTAENLRKPLRFGFFMCGDRLLSVGETSIARWAPIRRSHAFCFYRCRGSDIWRSGEFAMSTGLFWGRSSVSSYIFCLRFSVLPRYCISVDRNIWCFQGFILVWSLYI